MSWKPWAGRYAARGYCAVSSVVPAVEVGRGCGDWDRGTRDEAAALAVVDYYERLVRTLPGMVLLIGHCFGGLVVQQLLERGHGAAGAVVSPAAHPVRPPLAHLRPDHGFDPVSFLRIDYQRADRPPLLLVGCGRDTRVPARSVARTASWYEAGGAPAGYLEYPDRSHEGLSTPGWEVLAEDMLDWLELQLEPPVSAPTPGWEAR
jgi:alpha-beta hydrolase superfamily lysophospholipase